MIDGHVLAYDITTSPMYSTLLVPKGHNLSSLDSRRLLLELNIKSIRAKFNELDKAVSALEDTAHDAIAEKANTARRYVEQLLKFEIAYRELDPRDTYGNLLLGDLVSIVKNSYPAEMRRVFNIIAQLANELSHDSGKPIEKAKAQYLVGLASMLAAFLDHETRIEPIPRPSPAT
jgi:hypothetical protein